MSRQTHVSFGLSELGLKSSPSSRTGLARPVCDYIWCPALAGALSPPSRSRHWPYLVGFELNVLCAPQAAEWVSNPSRTRVPTAGGADRLAHLTGDVLWPGKVVLNSPQSHCFKNFKCVSLSPPALFILSLCEDANNI